MNDSIHITTPAGMRVHTGSFAAELKWNPVGSRFTGSLSHAQSFVDSEVLWLSSPYVPFRTGMLEKSGILGTEIGSGEVRWTAPYAAAQYYNTADTRRYDPMRGGHWFERMKIDHGDGIIRGAKKLGGRNG